MTESTALLPLCDRNNSVLVLIDIQAKLAGAMPDKIMEKVITDTQTMIQAAGLLSIPVLVSEQYPAGLGSTVAELGDSLPAKTQIIDKTCFSCASNQKFKDALKALDKNQVIIAGMETHVCVIQTAIELLRLDYQVYVATDAICSRKISHHQNAIQRMQHAGCITTNSESVCFEWLRDASHAQFKAISKLIK